MKKNLTTLILLALTILLVIGAIKALKTPRPMTQDTPKFNLAITVRYFEEQPKLTPEMEAEYDFLGFSHYEVLEELGKEIKSYPEMAKYPVVKSTIGGKTYGFIEFTDGIEHATALCWLVGLLAVVIVFVCALNIEIKLWPILIYASSFSLLIVIARWIAAAWYPAVFCVTWLCMAAFFALPFIFILQFKRFMSAPWWLVFIIPIAFIAFLIFTCFIDSFFLLSNFIWLTLCCIVPSLLLLAPKEKIRYKKQYHPGKIMQWWPSMVYAFAILLGLLLALFNVKELSHAILFCAAWNLPFVICIQLGLLRNLSSKISGAIVGGMLAVMILVPLILGDYYFLVDIGIIADLVFILLRARTLLTSYYAWFIAIVFYPIIFDQQDICMATLLGSFAMSMVIQLAFYLSRKKAPKSIDANNS